MRTAILAYLFATLFAFGNAPAQAQSAIGPRIDNLGSPHLWRAQTDRDKTKKKPKKDSGDRGSKGGSPGSGSY